MANAALAFIAIDSQNFLQDIIRDPAIFAVAGHRAEPAGHDKAQIAPSWHDGTLWPCHVRAALL